MKILKLFLIIIPIVFAGINLSSAQKSNNKSSIVGTVIDEKTREALPYVQILVKGTTVGTTTDANGNYKILNLPAGDYTIVASFIGYATITEKISLKANQKRHLDLYMEEQGMALDDVVVSANRQETIRRLAPTLVTVLGSETLVKTNSENLSQGLRFQPGLRIEDNCQNCGFNQVRINGLEGTYSQILIDSRSVYSPLIGVYGLEQIPASMIERVEVIRGGGSALFGSSAIGGVINVITKEPLRSSASLGQTITSFETAKGLSSPMYTTSMNASLVTEDHRAAVMVFGQHTKRIGLDYDGDSFTELPELRQRSFGFRSYYKTGLYSKITGEYRSMHEYRRGGDRLELAPFQSQIAEFLQHYVNGASLRYDQGTQSGKDNFSLYASAQHVLRRSYYGGGDYIGDRLDALSFDKNLEEYNKLTDEGAKKEFVEGLNTAKDELLTSLTSYGVSKGLDAQAGATYVHTFGFPMDLTIGLEATYSSLNDKSGYRPKDIEQVVNTYSNFTQLEYKTDKWNFLLGGRLDYVLLSQNGQRSIDPLLIFSPRANLRYNPIKDLSFRLSYSEGFRAPQFFDEELHVELAGGEPVARILSKDLKEERSHSVSFSTDWYKSFGPWQLNIMGEGFFTAIRDQFINSPIEKEENGIKQRTVINNKDGFAKVYGLTLDAKLAYKRIFEMQAGLTLQKSLYGTDKVLIDEEIDEKTKEVIQEQISTKDYDKTPNIYGYLTSTIRPIKDFSINLSATYTGSMLVLHEAYEGAPDGIKVYANGRFDSVIDGQRYRGTSKAELIRSNYFIDVDAKLNYEFDLSHYMKLNLSAGVQNIFNSYQKDTDMGPSRTSTYVYGPMQGRRYFVSATLNI